MSEWVRNHGIGVWDEHEVKLKLSMLLVPAVLVPSLCFLWGG